MTLLFSNIIFKIWCPFPQILSNHKGENNLQWRVLADTIFGKWSTYNSTYLRPCTEKGISDQLKLRHLLQNNRPVPTFQKCWNHEKQVPHPASGKSFHVQHSPGKSGNGGRLRKAWGERKGGGSRLGSANPGGGSSCLLENSTGQTGKETLGIWWQTILETGEAPALPHSV